MEWEQHKINPNNSRDKWREGRNCSQFTFLDHVTHVETACRIIYDRTIASRLVYDHSKLNTSRIHVTWVSPNDWSNAGGSRYGSIRFRFEANAIIPDGAKIYWVEKIAYNVPALRFLVTNKNYDNILTPYDPINDDGPWRYNPELREHFFNSDICLEIMLDNDSLYSQIRNIDAVDHNRNMCNIHRTDPDRCAEATRLTFKTANIFLLKLLDIDPGLAHVRTLMNERTRNEFVYTLDVEVSNMLKDITGFGAVKNLPPGAKEIIVQNLVRDFARDGRFDFGRYVPYFNDHTDLSKAILDMIHSP